MYRCAQCVRTHAAQNDHFSSRGLAWFKIASLGVPKTFCHPRAMSRSLPHLTLTTSTSSLSHTSPILQSLSPTHSSLLTHDPCIHCDDSRRSDGSSDLPSPTSNKPKRMELDRNLQIEHQDLTRERVVGDDYQSPITDMVSSRCPTTSHRYTQIMIHQKALLTGTSKMDNYVRCWLHRCMYGSEKETLILLENPEHQGNLMQRLYRREKQVHNGLELITQDESQVHLESPEFQGNLKQCFHLTEVTNWFPGSRVMFILF